MTPHQAQQWTTHQLLAIAARLAQRSQDRALRDLGLTHATLIALQGLAAGPQSQDQLAARIKVQAQTMGRILSGLDAAGLISRARDPKNRRRIITALTAAGRAALEQAHRVDNYLPATDASERSTLRNELIKVIAALSSPAHRSGLTTAAS